MYRACRCVMVPSRRVTGNSMVNYCAAHAAYKYIRAEVVGSKKNVGLVRFHRPEAQNAFNTLMFSEIAKCIFSYEADDQISSIIVTGSKKVFCPGGDIKEVQKRTYGENQKLGFLNEWEDTNKCRKPVIAAVSGLALGGGFEFALTCDIIYASDTARFGLLEQTIGIICGGGATQRLAKSISKTRLMEMLLTANIITAHEAEKMGIISRVYPADKLLEESILVAEKIGTHSPLTTQLAKEAVNQAFETALGEGLKYETHLMQRSRPKEST